MLIAYTSFRVEAGVSWLTTDISIVLAFIRLYLLGFLLIITLLFFEPRDIFIMLFVSLIYPSFSRVILFRFFHMLLTLILSREPLYTGIGTFVPSALQ